MSEIANAMAQILDGKAKAMSGDIIAIAKVIEAAGILKDSGYEEEAALVIATLKSEPIAKVASSHRTEEVIFDITE